MHADTNWSSLETVTDTGKPTVALVLTLCLYRLVDQSWHMWRMCHHTRHSSTNSSTLMLLGKRQITKGQNGAPPPPQVTLRVSVLARFLLPSNGSGGTATLVLLSTGPLRAWLYTESGCAGLTKRILLVCIRRNTPQRAIYAYLYAYFRLYLYGVFRISVSVLSTPKYATFVNIRVFHTYSVFRTLYVFRICTSLCICVCACVMCLCITHIPKAYMSTFSS